MPPKPLPREYTEPDIQTTPSPLFPTTPPSPVQPQPDVVGRMKRFLVQEPPKGARTLFGETDLPGRVVRAIGDLMLPGSLPGLMGMLASGGFGRVPGMIAGPATRVTAGTLAAGGTALATGQDAVKAASEQAKQQVVGEALFAPLRFFQAQRAGQTALTAQATATKSAQAAYEQAKARHPEQVAAIKQQYKDTLLQAKATHKSQTEVAKLAQEHAQEVSTRTAAARSSIDAERVASDTIEAYKQQVSAWRDLPSGTKGMLEAVYGKGQDKLSAAFEVVMQDIAKRGKDQAISLSLKSAKALGVTPRLALDPETVMVNAAEAAKASLGKSRTPAYREVASALVDANLGNAKARGEYRAGQALIQFVDQNKLLEGEVFHPDRALAGLTQLKRLNALRGRGQGDVFRGPLPEAARSYQPSQAQPVAPIAVPPIPNVPRPVLPPVPSPPPDIPLPPGTTVRTIPRFPPFAAGVAAELPFALTGHHGYGAPFATGALLDAILQGKRVTTRAPVPPDLQPFFGRGPTIGGQMLGGQQTP